MRISSLMLLGLLSLLSACATMKADQAAVSKIKKVAIVGFTIEQKELEGFTLIGKKNANRTGGFGGVPVLAKESPQADKLVNELAQTLRTSFKWQVVDPASVKSNPSYAAILKDKTEGWQMATGGAAGFEQFRPNGMVGSYGMERLDAQKRKDLAQKLGVDAVVIARVVVDFDKGGGLKMLVGAGTYYPKAQMRFTLYGAKDGESVWWDFAASGKDGEGSNHILGITEPENVEKGVGQATRAAYSALIKRYRENRG